MKFCWLFGASALLAVSLAAQTTDAQRSLLQAIQRGDTGAMSRLLDSGIRPTITDDEDMPALMLATLFGDVTPRPWSCCWNAAPIRTRPTLPAPRR